MPSVSNSDNLNSAAALQELAQTFTYLMDFDRVVEGLQSALNKSRVFRGMRIITDRAPTDNPTSPASIQAGAVTRIFGDDATAYGTLQIQPEGAKAAIKAGDLTVLDALADFSSALLTQSLRAQFVEKDRELLRWLLNQAPAAVVVFDLNRQLIIGNELAIRWIEGITLPFNDFEQGDGSFHFRASGKLIQGEARRISQLPQTGWLVVLQDLTAEQVRMLELMQRETYRVLAQGSYLGFALIEGSDLRDGVLRRLTAVRNLLLPGEIAGPYDAQRIAIVMPGLRGLALRARLRKLRVLFTGVAGLRLGYSELRGHIRTPEALLDRALQRCGDYDEILRPALLVHEDSVAVAEMFALVLGTEFNVVRGKSLDQVRELLASETFEGFVTELEPRNGTNGIELMRYAREQQPGIRAFFTTVQRAPYGLPPGATETEAVILEKPFDIDTLRRTMRSRLAV